MTRPFEAYRLELTVFGALHVGTGETYPAYAYVPDERAGRVYLLDITRLLGLLSASEQQELIHRVAASPKQAQASLGALWRRDAERLHPALVREVAASKAFFGTLQNADRDLAAAEFRPLPVSLEGPYIPGSSLKGALRTAWLSDLSATKLDTDDLIADTSRNSWQLRSKRADEGMIRGVPQSPDKRKQPRISTALAQNLEATLLGNLNDRGQPDHYRDPFRALRLSDSAPLRGTRLERLGVVHTDERKRMNVTLLAETAPDHARLEFTLRYHVGLTEAQGKNPAGVSGPVDPYDLPETARSFYGNLLQNEWDYAEDNRLENAQKVYELLSLKLERDPELFPLRFGFGSGKFATTLADYMDEPETKTRKTAGSREPRGGVPLGWVLARLEPL